MTYKSSKSRRGLWKAGLPEEKLLETLEALGPGEEDGEGSTSPRYTLSP